MFLLMLSCQGGGSVTVDGEVPLVPEPSPAPTSPGTAPRVETTEVPSAAPPPLELVPSGATFAGTLTVVLATDPGVEVRYTLDGSDPTGPSAAVYAGPLELTASTTVRAVADSPWGAHTVAGTFLALDPDLDGFSSNLPLAVVWTEGDAPQTRSDDYSAATFSLFEPAASGRVTLPAAASLSSRAGIRVRGSSSAGYPKHPYRLELWEPEADEGDAHALLGMPSDADWVLGGPLNFDRALMRNALIYELSNQIGRYAPRTRFVELFVTDRGEAVGIDDYVGVYVVTERVERGADRVDVTQMLPTDVADPEVTGGWLFKEDRLGPSESGFTAGTAGGAFYFQQPFVYEDPAEEVVTPEQQQYLTGLLDGFAQALVSGQPYDATIDVDAWIDHHILNTFAKNPDAFRLSAYYHKERGGLLVAGPVWDFDRTLGCDQDTRAQDPTWWDPTNQTPDATALFEHGFWAGLFDDPAFRTAYFDRMADLLDNELSVANVHATIDAMALELDEAAARNFAKWSAYPPRGGSFGAEVTLLENWVAARHAWLQGCLALNDPLACTGD